MVCSPLAVCFPVSVALIPFWSNAADSGASASPEDAEFAPQEEAPPSQPLEGILQPQTAFADLPSLDGISVLVVDDEADVRDLLTFVLEECGAEVRAAASVPEALAAIALRVPDVLVSDISMPGEDGYGLIRRIRQIEAELGVQIPAAAVSAYADPETRAEALAAGFAIYVPKPVPIYDLAALVATLASRR